MARTKLQKIKDMPLSKLMSLSRADLEKATRELVRESNRRLTVMKKKKLVSPSTEYIKKHGGKFRVTTRSGKKKSVIELREEFQRAKGFLESKTSTVSGFREWELQVGKTLATQGIDYLSLNKIQKRRFWQAFAKIEELDRANTLKGSANYKTTVNEVYTAVKKGLLKRDIDTFAKGLNDELYAESEKDFDGFFTISDSENPFE